MQAAAALLPLYIKSEASWSRTQFNSTARKTHPELLVVVSNPAGNTGKLQVFILYFFFFKIYFPSSLGCDSIAICGRYSKRSFVNIIMLLLLLLELK